ncbi:putative two-component response regulator [Oscillibacter valericigenes Sjm18-20]|nr:putative two-component response regulator [Oscillibacter valericigenes Sjm18-20]
MKIYVIEDDQAVIDTLEDLIEQQNLGSICGDSGGKEPDEQSVLSAKPDIVLIDFLMPQRDGIQIVQSLKLLGCSAKYVMISQVSDKTLIGKAYHAGVDFFISKPINAIEVKSVIRTVANQIQNERTIASIRSLFGENVPAEVRKTDTFLKRAKLAMNQLGMSGEKGCIDILKICQYMHDNKLSIYHVNFGQLCASLSGTAPQSMEQRVRRAIAKGMRNLAQLGIEDYMNETFVEYAGSLFPFEEVKAEMDYIRRKRKRGGKVSVKGFIGGLLILSEQDEFPL